MSHWLISFSVLILMGCSDSGTTHDSIRCEGLIEDPSSLVVRDDFIVRSVQFSNGNTRYVLNGSIQYRSELNSFTVLLEKPIDSHGMNQVLSSEFPLNKIDSSIYDCYVYRAENSVVLEWETSTKRLRLEKKLNTISVR